MDKGGHPYILHPLAVMMKVEKIEEKIVAVLHDVIEDSDVTTDQLKEHGYPSEIIKAVDTLTHRQDESYDLYIDRISTNQLATIVKLADLEENMDLSRILSPTEKDKQRIARYQKAYQQLKQST